MKEAFSPQHAEVRTGLYFLLSSLALVMDQNFYTDDTFSMHNKMLRNKLTCFHFTVSFGGKPTHMVSSLRKWFYNEPTLQYTKQEDLSLLTKVKTYLQKSDFIKNHLSKKLEENQKV